MIKTTFNVLNGRGLAYILKVLPLPELVVGQATNNGVVGCWLGTQQRRGSKIPFTQ
jgi:hypothetical protein